jgi:hypothetical protein
MLILIGLEHMATSGITVFGQVEEDLTDAHTAMAIAWYRRELAPGARQSFSLVIRWGEGSKAPQLSILSLSIPSPAYLSSTLSARGRVTDADPDDNISVFAVLDNQVARMLHIASDLGYRMSEFEVSYTVADLGIERGDHVIDLYAIDSIGTISAPTQFFVTVNAPSPTSTPIPPPREAPDGDVIMRDSALGYYWFSFGSSSTICGEVDSPHYFTFAVVDSAGSD